MDLGSIHSLSDPCPLQRALCGAMWRRALCVSDPFADIGSVREAPSAGAAPEPGARVAAPRRPARHAPHEAGAPRPSRLIAAREPLARATPSFLAGREPTAC